MGNAETVTGFRREDLFRYKNQFYVPSNVVIAIAGNLPDDYKERVEEAFSGHQGEMPVRSKEVPVFTPDVKVKQKETEQTHLCFGLPWLAVGDEDFYTLVLLNNVLGGNMSSRLFRKSAKSAGLPIRCLLIIPPIVTPAFLPSMPERNTGRRMKWLNTFIKFWMISKPKD